MDGAHRGACGGRDDHLRPLCRAGGSIRALCTRPSARIRAPDGRHEQRARDGAATARGRCVRGSRAAMRAARRERSGGTAGDHQPARRRLASRSGRDRRRRACDPRTVARDRHGQSLAQSGGRGRSGRRRARRDRGGDHAAHRRHAQGVYRRCGRDLVEVAALPGFSNHVYRTTELSLPQFLRRVSRSRAISVSSSAMRRSRCSSRRSTSAASIRIGMCCGQLASHAWIVNTTACSPRAL